MSIHRAGERLPPTPIDAIKFAVLDTETNTTTVCENGSAEGTKGAS